MSSLSTEQFSSFFKEIYGYEPFPWQTALAGCACAGEWPGYIAVPTGSGKTAAIDAAVFALAVQVTRKSEERTAGRRIFYIVNRRVIVDEAFERARKIADALRSPTGTQPTVKLVADALRSLGTDNTAPLECVQLRGGIYRDQSWARSIVQPLVVCSTVDQVGSRLLFRGYGVSPSSWPVHAALVANDSLLLLDEAHISRPFAQTLAAFKRYHALGAGEPRKSDAPAPDSPKLPFAFIQMTATPPAGTDERQIRRLDDQDFKHPILAVRIKAQKHAQLVIAEKATGKNAVTELVAKLVAETERLLAAEPRPRSLAVLVNRVATAKEVYKKLIDNSKGPVTLLIGRMRPFDRDDVTKDLSAELRTKVSGTGCAGHSADMSEHDARAALPRIVVATQCLEVGADFDFDALVTECASLDSLRQRFGRLNRAGRPIVASASIVICADQIFDEIKLADPKNHDPIYSAALSRTWNWLNSMAADNTVDFGIEAMDAQVNVLRSTNEACFSALLSPTKDAPLLLPAHLDVWCQTNPEPTPQPEPALFLHGPQPTDADIQVCWRSDLGHDLKFWRDILSLSPPSALECLPVPIGQFRRWILGEIVYDTSDVLSTAALETSEKATRLVADAIIWRGPDDSIELTTPKDLRKLRPGDTLVLASTTPNESAAALGHFPNMKDGIVPDQAVRAWLIAKHRKLLRLPPLLLDSLGNFRSRLDDDSSLATLLDFAKDVDNDISTKDFPEILHAAAQEVVLSPNTPDNLREALQDFAAAPAKIFRNERYPNGVGLIVQTSIDGTAIPAEDPGDDSTSDAAIPISLKRHLADVRQAVETALQRLPLSKWANALITAAIMHDWGKSDDRFQALLLGGNLNLAWAQRELLAKSAKIPANATAYENARKRATLPRHFRHEFLSAQLAENAGVDDLTLHLVAAHHGYARPFAPVVLDENPPEVSITHSDSAITIRSAERAANPPHRLDSGFAERFWRLIRRFGWWNLAYLEAVLRLADQQVSASYQQSGD